MASRLRIRKRYRRAGRLGPAVALHPYLPSGLGPRNSSGTKTHTVKRERVCPNDLSSVKTELKCLLIGNLWTAPLCATASFPGGRNGLVRVLRDQIFCDFMLSTSDTCPSIGHAASEVPLHILTFDGFLDQFFNIHPIFHVCRWLSAPREGFTLLHQFVLLQQQCLNPFPPQPLVSFYPDSEGRQCPHSGVGEDFLARGPVFFLQKRP